MTERKRGPSHFTGHDTHESARMKLVIATFLQTCRLGNRQPYMEGTTDTDEDR